MKYPVAKLGAVTRKANDITTLLMNNPNAPPSSLRDHYVELISRVDAFSEAFNELSISSSLEERKDLTEWYHAKYSEFEYLVETAKNFIGAETAAEKEEVCSQVSINSRHSNVSQCSQFSTSSSLRLKLAERRAKAMAEKDFALKLSSLQNEEMKMKTEEMNLKLKLESEQNDLQRKKQLLKANKSIMESDLLEAEIDRIEGINTNTFVSPTPVAVIQEDRAMSPTCDQPPTFPNYNYVPLARVNDNMSARNLCDRQQTNYVSQGASEVRLPHNNVLNEQLYNRSNTFHPSVSASQLDLPDRSRPVRSNLDNDTPSVFLHQNAREIGREIAAAQAMRAGLPRVKLSTFDGLDLTKFNSFILEFERLIESQCNDNVFRFHTLVQHTTGHPQSLVMSCNQSDASKAFKDAKRLLIDRYGDQYAISHAYIQKLRNWPVIKGDNPKAIEDLSIYLMSCANISENMTSLNQLNSINEIMNIVSKLPYKLQSNFKYLAISLRDTKGSINFVDLVQFVQHESRVLNQPMFELLDRSTNKFDINPKGEKKRVLATLVEKPIMSTNNILMCIFCNRNGHVIDKCFKFVKLTFNDRSNFVKKSGFCFGCLASDTHKSVSCPNRLVCGECKGKHPTSLHRENSFTANKLRPISDISSPSYKDQADEVQGIVRVRTMVSDVSVPGVKRQKILHAIIPVRVEVKGREPFYVYAGLDGCSSDCWISSKFLKRLGITTADATVFMTTMEKSRSSIATKLINNLLVSDCQGNNTVSIPILYSKDNWPFDSSDVPKHEDIRCYKHLDKIPFDFLDANIELLIGMNMPQLIMPIKVIAGPIDGPYATYHKLGWALSGPIRSSDQHNISCFRTKLESYVTLESRIDSYFCREFSDSVYDSKGESAQDRKWQERVDLSIKLLPSERYQIDLPFRDDNVQFPLNVSQARARFKSCQRRFLKDPKYFDDYKKFMESMLQAKFAERIPDSEIHVQPGKCWYLVHHSVYHKVKQKIRIVFDCSLKYQHFSLNDQLLQGPDNTNSLLGVLLRFRCHQVAVMGDVEKMFYQVKVSDKHTNFLRFLWFPGSDPTVEPVHYRLLVHVFGATSSPSIANYALRRTAIDFEPSRKTQSSISVHDHFYVDDYLQSFESIPEAVMAVEHLRALLNKGGFNLTGFVSNSEQVMNNINPELLSSDVSLVNVFDSDPPCNHALGVIWDLKTDKLGFKMNLQEKPFTRRGLLAISFSLYDPLGLVSPALLQPKELFRETCRLKLGWDDPLPMAIADKWKAWLVEAPLLTKYRMARCYCLPGKIINRQLHIFSDGSEVAYGAVAYVRFVMSDYTINCSPIMAKTRLTPLSAAMHPTVPRIELQAANLATKLCNILNNELRIIFDSTYFWTDSSTVLRYIRNDTRRFHRYVANRVAYIRSLSSPEDWHYVPTDLNPADVASRGLQPSKFVQSKLWAFGPKFLSEPETEWPKPLSLSPINADDREVKPEPYRTATLLTKTSADDIFDRLLASCSSWHRLKRRFAWLLRIKDKLRGLSSMTDDLALTEIRRGEIEILKLVQARYYSEIISDLHSRNFRPKHCLRKLNPYLDSNGLIRVGGRLRQSKSISYDVKHPIILPNNSFISELIVRHYHIYACGHLGRESVRSALRSHYWIVYDSTLIRRVLRHCIICKRLKARPNVQLMSDLPHDRVEGDRPAFYSTGVDLFGPFYTTIGRKSQKRYGVVFSCMSSRAIHLEITASLTTDSFIMALRRFICRRGSIKIIRCDNGTNIVGAKNELQKEINSWNQVKIARGLELSEIEWRFRPPHASHFGGIWEREIRTVRQILNALLHEQPIKLSDESLCTLMCETEAILNNRPLTVISNDPDDHDALTPNHLLNCDSRTSFPPGLFDKSDIYSRKRWRQIQYLADVFWSRWRKSYLSLLQERQKWLSPQPSLSAGDLVLVVDQLYPRNRWPIGRIEEPIASADGLVRSVRVRLVKCKNIKDPVTYNIIERPISKIILLRAIETLK